MGNPDREVTLEAPSIRGPPADVAVLREEARQAFRDAVAAGNPLSGRVLGAMFDRSGRWGRDRIAEVRAEDVRLATETGQATDQTEPNPMAAMRLPRHGRTIAWVAFVSGIAASVAANVLHAPSVARRAATAALGTERVRA